MDVVTTACHAGVQRSSHVLEIQVSKKISNVCIFCQESCVSDPPHHPHEVVILLCLESCVSDPPHHPAEVVILLTILTRLLSSSPSSRGCYPPHHPHEVVILLTIFTRLLSSFVRRDVYLIHLTIPTRLLSSSLSSRGCYHPLSGELLICSTSLSSRGCHPPHHPHEIVILLTILTRLSSFFVRRAVDLIHLNILTRLLFFPSLNFSPIHLFRRTLSLQIICILHVCQLYKCDIHSS